MIGTKAYRVTSISGDLSVGRHIASGGNISAKGGHFSGNLRVLGWLDAPNVKHSLKGIYPSYQHLLNDYPTPQSGWSAVVSRTDLSSIVDSGSDSGEQIGPFVGDLYLCRSGAWVCEDAYTFNLIGDVHVYQREVEELTERFYEVELLAERAMKAADESYLSMVYEHFHVNLFNPEDQDIERGKYLGYWNGQIGSVNNDNYLITGYIPFTESMRWLTASVNGKPMSDAGGLIVLYDADMMIVNSYMSVDVGGIATWEAGVAYARFSIKGYREGNIQVEVGRTVSLYLPFGLKLLKNSLNSGIVQSLSGEACQRAELSVLNDGDVMDLDGFPWHVKKGLCLSFGCTVGSFKQLLVGKGYGAYRGRWLQIDGSEVSLRYYEGKEQEMMTRTHGLKIRGRLSVSVSIDDFGEMHVVIQSGGGVFECTFSDCYEMNYGVFAKSVGSTLRDCVLSATNKDFSKPLWVIGDSYLGVNSVRWPGYMKQFGYMNYLLDGLAGQTSSGGWAELQRLLRFGQPKYLLWLLGMNDGNADFVGYFERLCDICSASGIVLIAATIPTTPSRDKEYISSVVRSSGVRYIDLYKAMGTNGSGSWMDGYLDSDGVHPTALGAQAQAAQVLVDVPELMQQGRLTQVKSALDDAFVERETLYLG